MAKNNSMKIRLKKNRGGFSFVEVLVSMFLISVGLMAVVSLFSSNLVMVMNSRNQTIAGLLAQEGAELVVNIRDNNVANDRDSFSSTNLPSEDKIDCIIDISNVVMDNTKCGKTSASEKLYYSDAAGYIHLSGGKETKFKRKIDVDYTGDSTDPERMMKVTSFVAWGENFPATTTTATCNFANRCAYVETTLTKWREN